MAVKPDRWIREMCRRHGMIDPFEEKQVRAGVISYGLSSYGYDIRIADEFKIFTNVNATIVDPKRIDPHSMVDFRGEVCVIPPNSFALGRTVEYFRIPRNVITVCLGKCLSGDARLLDPETGDYRTLREFVDLARPATVSPDGSRLKAAAVSAHMQTGFKPVYRLTTRAGLEIKATARHPFRTPGGWTELRHLRPGDRIAAARLCAFFGRDDWPEPHGALLGLVLAEESRRSPGRPWGAASDPALAALLDQAARGVGGGVRAPSRPGRRATEPGRGVEPALRERIPRWLESLQGAAYAPDAGVPRRVFCAPRNRVATFLRTLLSGAGGPEPGESGVPLEYATTSKGLAYDVRHLLLRFGVFARIQEVPAAPSGPRYRVQITDPDMIRCFADQVGLVPGCRKHRALDRVLGQAGRRPGSGQDGAALPPPAGAEPRRCGRARVLEHSEGSAPPGSDLVWDAVDCIVPSGVEPVYDLTVPGVHSFVANDLVVHNSTYARCGIITNVTPFEPEWEGFATLEISNTTPLPARIYSNEGIAQVLFFESDEACEVSYADKQGKYQKQVSITLPRL